MIKPSELEKIKLFIFDIAGTTIEDKGQVTKAFIKTLEQFGLNIVAGEINSFRGKSKKEVIENLLKTSGLIFKFNPEDIYLVFQKNVIESYRHTGINAAAGCRSVFEYLYDKKIIIALNTGFEKTIAEYIFSKITWMMNYASFVVTDDDVKSGRPEPDLIYYSMKRSGIASPDNVAVVGDTIQDLLAADKAGVKLNIAVLNGAHTREQLCKHPHTHLIESLADLISV